MHHVKLKRNSRFTPRKMSLSSHAPLSLHYTNYFAVSRITARKNGQSHHHINRWEYLIIFSDIMFCFAVYCFSSVKVSLRERLKESNSKESIDFRVRTE